VFQNLKKGKSLKPLWKSSKKNFDFLEMGPGRERRALGTFTTEVHNEKSGTSTTVFLMYRNQGVKKLNFRHFPADFLYPGVFRYGELEYDGIFCF
jgi:hypothetical protein